MLRPAPRRLVKKSAPYVRLVLAGAIGCFLGLIVWAAPALALSSWSGSGSISFTSTPSSYGPCTGSGTSALDLSGDPSSLVGTLNVNLQSVSSACTGYFTIGPIADPVSGYLSGNNLYLTDSYGHAMSGPLSGSDLTLTFTTYPTSSGGGTCVQFCTTTYTMQMTGSGTLAPAGFLGGFGFAPTDAIAGVGLLAGVAAIGAAAASAAPMGGAAAAGVTTPVPATTGFPWVSFSDHFGSLAQIPQGAIRQDRPPPGRHLSRPPNGGNCCCCGTPLLYTVAGWFCPNPGCQMTDPNAARSAFPGAGQAYGIPQLQIPRT